MKLLLVLPLLYLSACAAEDQFVHGLQAPDEFTLVAERHLVNGIPARADDQLIHVVIEIPAGTTAKWEVEKSDGSLRWEMRDGTPRIVNYLGYPGNYGMVPSTILPKELGGDGDPLDVIVLGPAVGRGSVVRAKIIGVLKLLDRGEQDDKLLAVLEGTPLAGVSNLVELDASFSGVSSIVETWFENYKGPGKMKSEGYRGPLVANGILSEAIAAFDAMHSNAE
ncbi:MAG: inorganic pyrophosphatase [Planctomycetota bacterium]|jgi:inorganic pyrophosphatase